MAYSVLLVFDSRDVADTVGDVHTRQMWGSVVTRLNQIAQQNKAIQRLAENVLLLPLGEALQGLGQVLQSLQSLKYKYAILSEDIEWHEDRGG